MTPVRQEQEWLRKVGWPIAVDGQMGPRTRQARRDFRAAQNYQIRSNWRLYKRRLEWCAKNNGRITPRAHFYYSDWKSNGNGWIKVKRDIYLLSERVRDREGSFDVLSGYRDPVHNFRVGGASRSMHLFAQAVDPTRELRTSSVQAAGAGGIGISASGNCRHFDTGTRRTWRY